MNISDIAKAMTAKFGIDGLESKDGKIELEIDGLAVMIEETDGDVFMLNGLVGEVPAEGGEAFAKILLEGNMALMNTKAAALAKNPQSGEYVLIERLPFSASSDFESFCESLGKFVDTLESWRNILMDFNPAAAAASAIAMEEEAEILNALRNGFLRI